MLTEITIEDIIKISRAFNRDITDAFIEGYKAGKAADEEAPKPTAPVTNYDRIHQMNAAQLRRFLAEVAAKGEDFFGGYCTACPYETDFCEQECPISTEMIIRWWLQEKAI